MCKRLGPVACDLTGQERDSLPACRSTEQRPRTRNSCGEAFGSTSSQPVHVPCLAVHHNSLPRMQQGRALALAASSACTRLWRSCSCSLLLRGGSACAALLLEVRAARSSSVPLPMRSRRLLELSPSAAHGQASLSEQGSQATGARDGQGA